MFKTLLIIFIACTTILSDDTKSNGDTYSLYASVPLQGGATFSWKFMNATSVAFMLDYPFVGFYGIAFGKELLNTDMNIVEIKEGIPGIYDYYSTDNQGLPILDQY